MGIKWNWVAYMQQLAHKFAITWAINSLQLLIWSVRLQLIISVNIVKLNCFFPIRTWCRTKQNLKNFFRNIVWTVFFTVRISSKCASFSPFVPKISILSLLSRDITSWNVFFVYQCVPTENSAKSLKIVKKNILKEFWENVIICRNKNSTCSPRYRYETIKTCIEIWIPNRYD